MIRFRGQHWLDENETGYGFGDTLSGYGDGAGHGGMLGYSNGTGDGVIVEGDSDTITDQLLIEVLCVGD